MLHLLNYAIFYFTYNLQYASSYPNNPTNQPKRSLVSVNDIYKTTKTRDWTLSLGILDIGISSAFLLLLSRPGMTSTHQSIL